MRQRLALLVAATTSVVLLAFLLPLAVLVRQAARDDAIADATGRTQVLISVVAGGAGVAEVAEVSRQLRSTGLDVRVRRAADSSLQTSVTDVGDQVVIRQPVIARGRTWNVQTVVPDDRLHAGVARAWMVLAGLGVLLIGLSLMVADRLARNLTSPIEALAGVAHRLARGDLSARVEPGGPEEIRSVGAALNLLATRIGTLLTAEREAVADLSHRLRTPVTALRLGVESLPPGPDRDALTASVDDLTRQVDQLIREARRPVREDVADRCDAVQVVAERVAFWAPLAEDQGRTVGLSLPAGELPVRCSPEDLASAVDALLGNVLAHTPERSDFAVSVEPAAFGALVVVRDRGPGFDEHAVARGHSSAGSTGLGLDIARRTAQAAGGELTVIRHPDGAEIRLRLGAPV